MGSLWIPTEGCLRSSGLCKRLSLTFNAILANLLKERRIRLWTTQSGGEVARYLFVTPICQSWIDGLSASPGLPGQRRSRLSEYEQVAGLFDSYANGKSAARLTLTGMQPPFGPLVRRRVAHLSVWEARLADSRVFGWAIEPGVFIAVQGAYAKPLKSIGPGRAGSYEAFARSVDRWRRVAGFDHTHTWRGGDLDAFLARPTVSPI